MPGIINPDLLDASILYARFASAAYRDQTDASLTGPGKFQNELRMSPETGMGNKTDTQALLGTWGDDIVIAFRGTQAVADWISDANSLLVPNTNGVGKLHRGFKTAGDSVYVDVIKFIRSMQPKSTSRLYLCGHSLGGALALAMASRLTAGPHVLMVGPPGSQTKVTVAIPTIAGVFTYGAPRVGDDAFQKEYTAKLSAVTTNWAAGEDPVPQVPLFKDGYRHAVDKRFTLRQNAIGVASSDSLEDIHQRSLFGSLRELFGSSDVSKHSMENSYIPQLEAAKKNG